MLRLSVGLWLTAVAPLVAQEWPRFRGPNGSGVGAVTLPVQWRDMDYDWKVKLPGVGHASPVISGTRIFVSSGDDKTGTRFLTCLHAADGRTLWQREFPGELHRQHEDNSLASATPALDDKHVYVSWGNAKEFLVVALTHDGREAWRTDLGPYKAGHGFGGSAIVHDGVLIVPNEQNGPSTLVGIDCDSGKVLWKVARTSKSHYATPCIFTPAGRPAEVIFASYEHGITSLNPKTGAKNWELDIFYKGHVESSIASPIVAGDLILATCGWLGVNYETVAVRPYAGNAAEPEIVYRVTKTAPLVPTPLITDDLLFLLSDRGILTCVDVKTGKEQWRERVTADCYSSPVCAGKTIYCISRSGEVVAVAAARAFELLGRSELGEGTHATPALANGRMVLRTFTHLLSLGAAKRGGS